jgi:DNA sulfur modification protein DndB
LSKYNIIRLILNNAIKKLKSEQSVEPSFEYVFPVIRGVQAGREYYVSMCPLRLIPKIFIFDGEELIPELRAQRTLNKARIPEISRYILNNPKSYVFSAITASIDGRVRFEPIGGSTEQKQVGTLRISMDSRFIINDGQHRRAAIEAALRQNPDLSDETIPVVFFLDIGLERCQQMFADLNRYAIRPNKSIGVLYDNRDKYAILSKLLILQSPVFKDVVEVERSSLSPRSRKLFTLSSIYFATKELLNDFNIDLEESTVIALTYWEEVAKQFPEWSQVRAGKITSGEIRRDFIHSHSIALQALGRVGNALLKENSLDWKRQLKKLKGIDWSRANSKLWEGRAMLGGRVSKASHNIILTTNVLKKKLGLSLTEYEKQVENSFMRGEYGLKEKYQ